MYIQFQTEDQVFQSLKTLSFSWSSFWKEIYKVAAGVNKLPDSSRYYSLKAMGEIASSLSNRFQ